MEYDTYIIPANFTDAGKVMGIFELRNLVEAVLLAVPVIYLCITLLPLSLTPKIVITLSAVVPTAGFALIGVNDDSLGRWLTEWWQWRRSRRKIVYRGEGKSA